MIRLFCDRCSIEIGENESSLLTISLNKYDGTVAYDSALHVCPKCIGEFWDGLRKALMPDA